MQKLILAGILLVLVVAVLILETRNLAAFSSHNGTPPVTPTGTPFLATHAPTAMITTIIPLRITNHHLVASSSSVHVSSNAEIIFQITSDMTAPLTIDKYTTSVLLQKNKQVIFSFLTQTIGSFVIRLNGVPIGVLTVSP